MKSPNPYASSRSYNQFGYWADSFARGGKIKWLVFCGDELIAQVKGKHQAQNLLRHLSGYGQASDVVPDIEGIPNLEIF